MNICTRVLRSTLVPCLILLGVLGAHAETNPRYYAVVVSATVQAAPALITLCCAADASATGYNIYRKAPSATSWTHLTSLAGSATTWIDANVASTATLPPCGEAVARMRD